jgi:hypothetical protein
MSNTPKWVRCNQEWGHKNRNTWTQFQVEINGHDSSYEAVVVIIGSSTFLREQLKNKLPTKCKYLKRLSPSHQTGIGNCMFLYISVLCKYLIKTPKQATHTG